MRRLPARGRSCPTHLHSEDAMNRGRGTAMPRITMSNPVVRSAVSRKELRNARRRLQEASRAVFEQLEARQLLSVSVAPLATTNDGWSAQYFNDQSGGDP